jgi:hypothetical protein
MVPENQPGTAIQSPLSCCSTTLSVFFHERRTDRIVFQRGLVPTINYDGNIIPESGIVAQFLADAHPSHLLPESTPTANALYRARVTFFVDAFFSKVIPHFWAGIRAATEEEKEEAAKALVAAVTKEVEPLLEEGKGPFFGGSEKLTLAEVTSLLGNLRASLIFLVHSLTSFFFFSSRRFAGSIRLLCSSNPLLQQARIRSAERQVADSAGTDPQIQTLGGGDSPARECELHLEGAGSCSPHQEEVCAETVGRHTLNIKHEMETRERAS